LPAELSQEGKALLKRTETGIRAAEDRVLAPLNERDQAELRRILGDLG
jgi:hypothetical protein